MQNPTRLSDNILSIAHYRQPTFFAIENARENLGMATKCEKFPVALERIVGQGYSECDKLTDMGDQAIDGSETHFSPSAIITAESYNFMTRMRELKQERPWLVECSEKYMTQFGVSFAFGGGRAFDLYEGAIFYGMDSLKADGSFATFKMPAAYEKQFFDAIERIIPLGERRRFSDDVMPGMKGCQEYLYAFLFKLDKGASIGYLDKDIGSRFCEGTFYINSVFPTAAVREHAVPTRSKNE
jgi:hypothetical protein